MVRGIRNIMKWLGDRAHLPALGDAHKHRLMAMSRFEAPPLSR